MTFDFTHEGDAAAELHGRSTSAGPFTQDGSGAPVDGRAAPRSSWCAASPRTATTSRRGRPTYTGPKRITADRDAATSSELVETGDFEGVLTWVIGLDAQRAVRGHRAAARPSAQLVVTFS